MKSISHILSELTFNDLQDWAGETILNRGRKYVSRISQVWHADDNTLAAWVVGGDRYATSVRLGEVDGLEWFCTCPYSWGPCKHAIALILAAAECVKRAEVIPPLEDDQDLRKVLHENSREDFDSHGRNSNVRVDGGTGDFDTSQRTMDHSRVDAVLTDKSREEFFELLIDLSRRFPDVRRYILEEDQLASGQVDRLVQELMAEIQSLTAEPASYDDWRDEGSALDFSHVEQQLQALVAKNFPNAVLELGEELWTRGVAQVEQSDDQGQTADAIASCMEIVLTALPQSSLSSPEQLLWVIDRALDDEYSLLNVSGEFLRQPGFTPHHWREVAETLEARLQAMPKPRAPKFGD